MEVPIPMSIHSKDSGQQEDPIVSFGIDCRIVAAEPLRR